MITIFKGIADSGLVERQELMRWFIRNRGIRFYEKRWWE